MKSLDGLLDALRSLRSNKMRSVLTTLGIIIGVGAVIIMVSVGNGAREQISAMIDRLGANMMMVRPGSSFGRGVSGGTGSLPTLTEEDAMAIQNEIPTVNLAAPQVRGTAQLICGNLNWSSGVRGITNAYLSVRQWPLADGRMFDPEEIRASSKVAILGETVAENLFPDQDPIGQQIILRDVPFDVIGVLESKGQTAGGDDQDDCEGDDDSGDSDSDGDSGSSGSDCNNRGRGNCDDSSDDDGS